MIWPIKRTSHINPEELTRKAEESLKQTQAQQPKVNALTTYLENRKNQNGFGEDFEYTLKLKGT